MNKARPESQRRALAYGITVGNCDGIKFKVLDFWTKAEGVLLPKRDVACGIAAGNRCHGCFLFIMGQAGPVALPGQRVLLGLAHLQALAHLHRRVGRECLVGLVGQLRHLHRLGL